MALKIINTQEWSIEQIATYGRDLTAAMTKLCEKFPDDLTVKSIMADIISGKNQLWLILDENDKFKAFVTTEIFVSEFTNKKRLHLCDLGGEGGVYLADLVTELEKFALSQGINEIHAMGRFGWQRQLAKHGYKPIVFRFGKDLTA
jgi:ethanolamine utilization protein EutQ (cupin superfamily)